jgi:hypothetical protein
MDSAPARRMTQSGVYLCGFEALRELFGFFVVL